MILNIGKFAAPLINSSNDIGIPQVDASQNTIAQIMGSVFIIVGALAVLFMLVGAARYVAANGDQKNITQAKNTILYALVGVVVSMLGFTIVQFTIGKLNGSI